MSRVEPLALRVEDRTVLQEWVRAPTVSAGAAQRARTLLLAADGETSAQISRLVGVSSPTVRCWRDRYLVKGLAGLGDLPRSGRPVVHDENAVIAATLDPPPAKLGVTRWSARLLADELRDQLRHRGADLAAVGAEAVEVRDVQVLHWP